MKVKVKSIEIDFSDAVCDCPPNTNYQNDVIQSVLDSEWIVNDEEEIDYNNNVEDPEVLERIFDDVGNIDYIYQVIQECVDEVTEEQVMAIQQEQEQG